MNYILYFGSIPEKNILKFVCIDHFVGFIFDIPIQTVLLFDIIYRHINVTSHDNNRYF